LKIKYSKDPISWSFFNYSLYLLHGYLDHANLNFNRLIKNNYK
jgi:hypothetical protein